MASIEAAAAHEGLSKADIVRRTVLNDLRQREVAS
jgi:hypothetical protein